MVLVLFLCRVYTEYGRKNVMAKKYVYRVYHGWAFPKYITEFSTMKGAVLYIERQADSDCWCFEKVEK